MIAPREVKSISDLQGKTVSFGDLDSATSTSGRMLFSRLGVTATQTNEPLPEALDRLSAGKVDAVVILGAEDSPALSDFGSDGRFHIVPIPWSSAFEPVYAPAHVTAADRPNLVNLDRSGRNDRRTDGAGRARCGPRIAARGWTWPNCAALL